MSDLQSKTDEELNVTLAELVGWKFWQNKYGTWVATNPFGAELAVPGTIEQAFDTLAERLGLPRYCSSLDEVAKVEAGLTDEQQAEYVERYLPFYSGAETREQGPIDFWKLATATARHRTIALIQTLK